MFIETLSEPWQVALATNSTDATYPVRAFSQTSAPTKANNPGLIPISVSGAASQNLVRIIPLGVGSDDQTFMMRILHWHHDTVSNLLSKQSWYRMPIGDFTCTLGSLAGVAGTLVPDTALVVDTITLTAGYATQNVSCEVCSNAANEAAHILLSLKGAKYIEFLFNLNSSATSCNALLAML
jgi:hypothetical protein